MVFGLECMSNYPSLGYLIGMNCKIVVLDVTVSIMRCGVFQLAEQPHI